MQKLSWSKIKWSKLILFAKNMICKKTDFVTCADNYQKKHEVYKIYKLWRIRKKLTLPKASNDKFINPPAVMANSLWDLKMTNNMFLLWLGGKLYHDDSYPASASDLLWKQNRKWNEVLSLSRKIKNISSLHKYN